MTYSTIIFQAFDQHMNMVLGNVEETIKTVEVDEDTLEEIVKVRSFVVSFHPNKVRSSQIDASNVSFCYDYAPNNTDRQTSCTDAFYSRRRCHPGFATVENFLSAKETQL